MKITILNDRLELIKDGISVEEASEFLDCKEVNVYKLSAKGWRRNGYYIARTEDYATLNAVLLYGIKEQVQELDPQFAHRCLITCYRRLTQ